VPILSLALAQLRDEVGLPIVLLVFLALVVLTAAIGGTLPAVVAAILSFLAANWYFTPPYHRWTIADGENVVVLGVFLGVALVVSGFVDAAARRASDAAWARDQARTLARLAAMASEPDRLPALLAQVLARTGLDDGADMVEEGADVVLALSGPSIPAEDQLVLNAFAAQLAAVIERSRLRAEATAASTVAQEAHLLDCTKPSSGSGLPR
jgi:two-component system, OmpR family, sensor histidine kinase KdpD